MTWIGIKTSSEHEAFPPLTYLPIGHGGILCVSSTTISAAQDMDVRVGSDAQCLLVINVVCAFRVDKEGRIKFRFRKGRWMGHAIIDRGSYGLNKESLLIGDNGFGVW